MTQLLYKLKTSALFCFFTFQSFSQEKKLDAYIPRENTSLLTHPIITIKLKLHLIYRYEDDKQNYTLDSLGLIRDQFKWINTFYKHLSPSTLIAQDSLRHFIPDSRIQFRLDSIDSVVDSVSWNRIYITKDTNAIDVISTDVINNKIYFDTKDYFRVNRIDSISINDVNYSILSRQEFKKFATITVNKPILNPDSIFYTYRKKDLNCDRYLWEKHTNKDKNYLHIFYTGSSSSGVAFGCGPAPYFLNVSNLIKGGGWANAQLVAHELGHTVGLNHTNYPQFDDLPPKDKFGFIPCDSNLTSNNIMGYNQCRNYLSPKQVGHVHQLYSINPDRIRLTTANDYNPENTVIIWEDTTWNKSILITGDIVVKKRQTLTLNKSIHLSKDSKIYLEKKSKLILNGIELNNHFGTNWGGIVYCKSVFKPSMDVKKKKNRGVILFKKNASIKNSN